MAKIEEMTFSAEGKIEIDLDHLLPAIATIRSRGMMRVKAPSADGSVVFETVLDVGTTITRD